MKPTACGRWCHSACGLWTEETRLDAERGVITGVQEVRVGVSAEGRGGGEEMCVIEGVYYAGAGCSRSEAAGARSAGGSGGRMHRKAGGHT